MSEVSTLNQSMDKCFAEQHAMNKYCFEQLCFDQQQNDLKKLTVQYEDLEDKVELLDCFYAQMDGYQEENRRNLEKLEKEQVKLEDHLGKLEDRVEIIDEGDDKRLDLLEERVVVLNAQNIELMKHLNLTIEMLNNVTRFLNSSNKEQSDEATQVHEVTTSHEDMMDVDKSYVLSDKEQSDEATQVHEVTTSHEDMMDVDKSYVLSDPPSLLITEPGSPAHPIPVVSELDVLLQPTFPPSPLQPESC